MTKLGLFHGGFENIDLAAAAERGPQDFSELLLVPGVGARTIRALAQVAEVVPITAVIFDLDGTLVDSAPDIQVAINKLLAR